MILLILGTLLSLAARPGEAEARAILGLRAQGEGLHVQAGPVPRPTVEDPEAPPGDLADAALADLVLLVATVGAGDTACAVRSCSVPVLRVFAHASVAQGSYAQACVFFAAIARREPSGPDRLMLEGCLAERFVDTPRAQVHLEHARCLVDEDARWMQVPSRRPAVARAEVARWHARAAASAHLDAIGGIDTEASASRARRDYAIALELGPSAELESHVRAALSALGGSVLPVAACDLPAEDPGWASTHLQEARSW